MKVCKSLSELEEALALLADKEDIGFVPTMGALHEGHISLVKSSLNYAKTTIVSIFVNPTQFNNIDDLTRYPRTVEADCLLLATAGTDIVFIPTVKDIYPQTDSRVFDLGGLDNTGEGPRRPGHFNGVAQVVTRLFDLVKPKYAFFGEKDFQQLSIIKYFTKKLGYPINVISCPTLREDDGLAMSSRNTLLTHQQREVAPHIYRSLKKAKELTEELSPNQLQKWLVDTINSEPQLEVEYVEIVDSLTLQLVKNWNEADDIQLCTAVYAKPIRLIDNIKLK